MKRKIYLGLVLFGLGFIGILSMLTMDIPLPEEIMEVLQKDFSSNQIKLLTLINPTIMLLVATVLGVVLHENVNLKSPIITGFLKRNYDSKKLIEISKYGLLMGVLSGVLLLLIQLAYNPFLPNEFIELGEKIKPSIAARFLYGGLTEEILLRFGLMTFIVWLASKVFKSLSPQVYWIGIIISSILFALGHFPIVFQSIDNPSITLMSFILIGNSVSGVLFGWLYWKKGLESAFIGHIITHVVLLLMQS